jgi:hypothetical protein
MATGIHTMTTATQLPALESGVTDNGLLSLALSLSLWWTFDCCGLLSLALSLSLSLVDV